MNVGPTHETASNKFLVSAPFNILFIMIESTYEMYVCLLTIAFGGYLVS